MSAAATGEQLLDVREVAQLLSIGEMTVYRLTYRGELSFVRIGRIKRFRPSDIENYLRRQTHREAA